MSAHSPIPFFPAPFCSSIPSAFPDVFGPLAAKCTFSENCVKCLYMEPEDDGRGVTTITDLLGTVVYVAKMGKAFFDKQKMCTDTTHQGGRARAMWKDLVKA